MSVVHQLSPGWLLDHLSFINKINYRVHQPQEPCCRKNESTSVGFDSPRMDSKSSFGSSATFVVCDSTTKPGNKDGGNCGMFTQKYAFRSELFHVTKPYITAAVHGEGQQRSEREDAANGVKKETATSITGKRWNSGPCTCEAGTGTTELNPEAQKLDIFETFPAINRKKRKKCVVFNQGELDAMEYHTKIREQILDGSLRLIQEGLKSGFLYQLFEKQDQRSEPTSLPPDACSLPGLCELAKRSQALGEVELPTLRLREEDLSVAEQDLLSRVVENDSSFSKMITLMGQKYLLPPKSSFLLSDISCMQPLLNCRKTFDAIVIDPPWQNKSVKRSNRYSYLSPLQIQQVPIPQLAAPDCLVVTWVTNRQKHLRFVKDELYPSWSVAALAEWHWVKPPHRSGHSLWPPYLTFLRRKAENHKVSAIVE
ncbi:N(6)-adenine-specific DNA methyltransferase METTL4 isoform X2 [Fukomys damarensis]|uniref:N(6)-adenine-specific DNA methyltransferase METTL4 isoform X2 n=1 Tax=Fukomys damarensis TaxID=885580 RepID=UPI00053FDCE5|nr:N(6)-adenine-specific DNA methyltransferase METTL4 isoform X2 [Fukomys damarensis]